MSYIIGSGYIGSLSVQVSTANQEIIPSPPSHWSTKYKLYKFSFYNEQNCTVKINGGSPIFLRANQGFNIDLHDAPIYSFVIVEPNISYNWIGAY
jgi:hypothetical protein